MPSVLLEMIGPVEGLGPGWNFAGGLYRHSGSENPNYWILQFQVNVHIDRV